MKFRPCIDIHEGKVKQIVGSTLRDSGVGPETNFESERPPEWFAELYKSDELTGGHVIMLGRGNEDTAIRALKAYPGGLQVGGGIKPENAKRFLDAGASHVIVTSYVFKDGQINWDNLEALKKVVGKDRLVLDLSCRRRDGRYFIVTDRWQKFTDVEMVPERLDELSEHCNEYLVHGVDVEGKQQGVEADLVRMLGEWNKLPTTYAGGIKGFDDIRNIYSWGQGKLDFTVGSALDIFGGNLPYKEVVAWKSKI
ncbi:MAG: phosphoribosylformimino-5-aminoimidazole carboxamide ribotide isomerase [Candidatus Aenigmarchaeota archaeon]|nr:phosphoribosylformimino-5-aminoimidazole carboxamide ribotide isomerase [Candidatus Aenigmarchaeota archaeon]